MSKIALILILDDNNLSDVIKQFSTERIKIFCILVCNKDWVTLN